MFPNFTSLSQREKKRLDLLKQAERDISNDNAKRQAYEDAMWTSDVEKNRINLSLNRATLSTQTDAPSAPSSTSRSTRVFSTVSDIGDVNDSVSEYADDVEMDSAHGDDIFYDAETGENFNLSQGRLRLGMFDDDEEETKDDSMDSEEQGGYRDKISELYAHGSKLYKSQYRPRDTNGNPMVEYYFGINAKLFRFDKVPITKATSPVDRIDWQQTYAHIKSRVAGWRDWHENAQGEYRDKIYEMFDRLPELSVRKYSPIDRDGELMGDYYFGSNALLQHRRGANPTDDNNPMDRIDWRLTWSYIKAKDGRDLNRLLDPFDVLKANKGRTEDEHARKQLSMLVSDLVKAKGDLAKKQLKQHFQLYGTDGKSIPGYRLAEYSADIRLQKKKNVDAIPDIDNKVSWALTMKHLLQSMDEEGTLPASEFVTSEKKESRTTVTDDLYIKRIELIFETLPWLWSYGINPVVRSKIGKPQFTNNFHFGPKGNILDPSGNPAPANSISALYDRVLWGHSYSRLIEKLKSIQKEIATRDGHRSAEDLKRSKQLIRIIETHNDSVSPIAPVKAEEVGKGFGKIQLRGRGLMGAGAKNLRDIEGSGSASDLKYKRLGSKFIRVADLRSNKLKLVFPNRTPVGRLRSIDPKLSKLIDKLVFNKDIDQHLYGQLSIDDKKLFIEILKTTHLQHQFSNALEDPVASLRAEFDKLLGQVQLGNDNPDLIRELKTMAVDLYAQKLIDEADFKSLVLM